MVTGYSGVVQPGLSENPPKDHAWVYSGGTMTDIMYANGIDGNGNQFDNESYGYGINNAGTVVGYCDNTTLSSARAFVMSGGSMLTIDNAWGSQIQQSRAYGVNSAGPRLSAPAQWNGQIWNPMVYSYSGTCSGGVYSGGAWSYTNLDGVLGGSGTGYCFGVNDAGTVTGYVPNATSGTYYHAFVRTSAGVATDLGVQSGYNNSLGEGINATGDVVGYNYGPGFTYNAFLATTASGYTMTPLAMPSTVNNTLAYSVNKYDMAVGYGYLTATGDNSYDALLWNTGAVPFYNPLSGSQAEGLPTGVYDLNTLVASVIPSGYVLNTARSINDAGQIAGTASYEGESRAYILSLPQALPGDANLDGKVDINDLTIVLAHYNQSVGMSWGTGDFTGSGKVDINDLTIVLAHYNQSVGASLGAGFSAVPEPGSLLLLALAAIGLLAYAGRKANS